MIRNFLIIFMTATALSWAGEGAGKTGNTCYTESVTARKGVPFGVGVYVNNRDTLAGMQVPIYYRSDSIELRCDSVNFAGSRAVSFNISDFKIEQESQIVYFVLIDTGGKTLPPGDGLVATLWFTPLKSSQSGKVELFSGPDAFLADSNIDYSYLFWLPSAKQVECEYKAGYITVK